MLDLKTFTNDQIIKLASECASYMATKNFPENGECIRLILTSDRPYLSREVCDEVCREFVRRFFLPNSTLKLEITE